MKHFCVSCKNYFASSGQSRYQTVSQRSGPNDSFKIRVTDHAAYIEQTTAGRGVTWEDVEKIPGKYALKDGNSISVYHSTGDCGYKFYHAAESTEEYPVLVAKGVDEHGTYFEEKINVKQINPYDTSTLELQALAHFKPGEYKSVSNPYDCMYGQEKGLRERFNFVAGAQTLIHAWRRIGHAGQAGQWNDELNFLLGYTENIKRNLELYCNAAMERLAAGMAKRCSEIERGMPYGLEERYLQRS